MTTTPTHSCHTPLVIRGLYGLALAGLFGVIALGPQTPRVEPASLAPATAREAREAMSAVQAAMSSWLTDQISRQAGSSDLRPAAAGPVNCLADLSQYPVIEHAAIEALLVPAYIAAVPERDPWGNSYDYRLNQSNLLSAQAIALRSAGADGVFEGDVYDHRPTTGPDDDLVAADGVFLRDVPRLDPISRQGRSREDIGNTGAAWLSWLVDNISRTPGHSEPAPQSGPVDLTELQPVTYAELVTMLVPPAVSFYYLRCVPRLDGWGHPYEFFLNNNLLASNVLAIRSPGADGVFEGDVYTSGTFPADNFDRDTVWANGFFVQRSDGEHDLIFLDTFETGSLWGTWSECLGSP